MERSIVLIPGLRPQLKRGRLDRPHGASSVPLSRPPVTLSGSFLFAIVCADGVLIAAESRGMLRSSSGKDLAYYDGVQKVFPIGRHALAYTGNETIQNLYFGAFVDAFVRQAPTDIPLTQLLSTFLAFADNTLPPQASTIVRQQSLVVAGYSGGQAMACYHNDKQTVGPKTTCGVGFVASDVTELDDIKPKLRSMTAVRVAPLAEQAIARYAKDKKHLDVGGPLHARHLTETTGRWIGEPPPRRPWNYLHDFAAAYWRGEIALTLAPGSTKAELDDMIGKADKWSRGVLQ